MNRENCHYLSGFTGTEGCLLITADSCYLCADFRYLEQAKMQARGFAIAESHGSSFQALASLVEKTQAKKIGFEEEHVTYQVYRKLVDLKLPSVQWLPVAGIIEALRMQKDQEELAAIKKAAAVDDLTYKHILDFIQPGLRERDIALELEFFARKQGGEAASFDFIVASGPRSALPHGTATDRILTPGDLLVLDFGTVVSGYHSDFTRTIVIGEPTAEQLAVHQVVQLAQREAIAAVCSGRSTREIDAIARQIIAEHGYGQYFGHGLGHGVGLNIHEGPHLALHKDCILRPGMVITIEPGIYIPQWGGVRIEDMVVVTESGYEVLEYSSRELFSIY
jgi:Xaa-Pro aminopeptidase